MTDYAAEMDRILAEFRSRSRSVQEQFLEADARTARAGVEVFAELRESLRETENPVTPTLEELVAQEERAERDRMLREAAERVSTRVAERRKPQSGRDAVVMPSDWTEEDEARAEGYGPPESWLR